MTFLSSAIDPIFAFFIIIFIVDYITKQKIRNMGWKFMIIGGLIVSINNIILDMTPWAYYELQNIRNLVGNALSLIGSLIIVIGVVFFIFDIINEKFHES